MSEHNASNCNPEALNGDELQTLLTRCRTELDRRATSHEHLEPLTQKEIERCKGNHRLIHVARDAARMAPSFETRSSVVESAIDLEEMALDDAAVVAAQLRKRLIEVGRIAEE